MAATLVSSVHLLPRIPQHLANVSRFKPLGSPARLLHSAFSKFSPTLVATPRRRYSTLRSVVDLGTSSNLATSPLVDDEEEGYAGQIPSTDEESAEYDWTEEWYPLYLSREVPDDAPLGFTVYDRQLVLYKDGKSGLRCFDDRCPHRMAKLSEGQIIDGKLECLYHGWQFSGEGNCVRIPQLPEGATIPRSACASPYVVKESQGVVWVWMSQTKPPDETKLPWFEHFARPDFLDISMIHELPYDHSVLLENIMDPAHVPISHNRTDPLARREKASPLIFEVTERTSRGFAGWWRYLPETKSFFLRFEAPCAASHRVELPGKNGKQTYATTLFLCRPSGQGKSMVIARFGTTEGSLLFKLLPNWLIHLNGCKVFEEDMGFLSSQSQAMMQQKVPTKTLYLNLKSSDVWVYEYRKWMDRVGIGMPYHIGHNTASVPCITAVEEQPPGRFVTGSCSSLPDKGVSGAMYLPNLANRYFRHVVHCKECRKVVRGFESGKKILTLGALLLAASAILASNRQWKMFLVVFAGLCIVGVQVCSFVTSLITTNSIRSHRV